MKMKILGLFGVLTVAAVPVWMVAAADDAEDVEEEIIEIEEDEDVADTAQKVVARVTCDEMKVRISELQALTEPEDAEVDELNYLLKKQRTQCAAKGRSRPVRNYINMTPQEIVEEIQEESEVVPEKPKKKKKKKKETTEQTESKATEETVVVSDADKEKERAENLANGLCGDGAKPNKFGCCEGEKFKDLGDLKFACCPKEGDGECHAPLK